MTRLLKRFSASNPLKTLECKWFGQSLESLDAKGDLGGDLPAFIHNILEYIEEDTTDEPYEVSPQENKIALLKGLIEEDGKMAMLKTIAAGDAVSFIALFLSELPQSVLPTEDVMAALTAKNKHKLNSVLKTVTNHNRILAQHIAENPRLINLLPYLLRRKSGITLLDKPSLEMLFVAMGLEFCGRRSLLPSYSSQKNIHNVAFSDSSLSPRHMNDSNSNLNDFVTNYFDGTESNKSFSRESSLRSEDAFAVHPQLPPLPPHAFSAPSPRILPSPRMAASPRQSARGNAPRQQRDEGEGESEYRMDARPATPNSIRTNARKRTTSVDLGNSLIPSPAMKSMAMATTPSQKAQYFPHPLWGALDDKGETEFPLTAPQYNGLTHNSSGVFSKYSRLELERLLLSTQQQLRESQSRHVEDVEGLQDVFEEERSKLLHQISQARSSNGALVVAETEHQIVNAIEMEMRARRAEREAMVARDEAWKEHNAAQEMRDVADVVDQLSEENEKLREEVEVLKSALRYSDTSTSLLKDLREREGAANQELRAHKEQEALTRKEMMRLRAEIDALRAQVLRANQAAPDAQDINLELASVRASIYDAKSKNEALLEENQRLTKENADLTKHVQHIQKQHQQQLQQLQQQQQQQQLQYQQQQQSHQQQYIQQQLQQYQQQLTQHQHQLSQQKRQSPSNSSKIFDTSKLAADLENAENRVKVLEQALNDGSRQRSTLKAELKALYA